MVCIFFGGVCTCAILTLSYSRNCTKHQVRCDYQDLDNPPDEVAATPQRQPSLSESEAPVADLFYSPEIESILKHWQLTGEATLGDQDISVNLQVHGQSYSLSDLHLLYYALSSVQNVETNGFAVTMSSIPGYVFSLSMLIIYSNLTYITFRFFKTASSQPYVVHAILAISAGALAWETSSAESKKLAYHHGSIAMKALRTAMDSFSKENSEAITSAFVLLSWQANDWSVVHSLLKFGSVLNKSEGEVGHLLYKVSEE